MERKAVTSISVTYNVALVTIENLPGNTKLISEILNSIAQQKINIDMISQAPPYKGTISLSFSLPSEDLVKALSTLNTFKKQVPNLYIDIDAQNTKISVFGESMKNIPGVAARLFTVLADNGVEIKLVTTSEVDISYLVYDRDVDKTLSAIKNEYGLN